MGQAQQRRSLDPEGRQAGPLAGRLQLSCFPPLSHPENGAACGFWLSFASQGSWHPPRTSQ